MGDPAKCPSCGGVLEQDSIDVGVGVDMPMGQPYCDACQWVAGDEVRIPVEERKP